VLADKTQNPGNKIKKDITEPMSQQTFSDMENQIRNLLKSLRTYTEIFYLSSIRYLHANC